MIKCRYIVQIGYSADVDEADPRAKSFEDIKKVAANMTKNLEEQLIDYGFDTSHGEKLVLTEILNEVTQE